MEIRAITQNDEKNFIEFYEKLSEENDSLLLTPKELKEMMKDDIHKLEHKYKLKQVFIALDEDDIVGYLSIKHIHFEKIRHLAKMTLGYLKEYQEKENVGAKLVEYAENWAEENNIRRLEILVLDEDEDLEDLLDDLEFKKEGKRKHTIKIKDKYHDETIMVKEL